MFTVKEVAFQLGLSSRAIYRAVEKGDLEHHRFGSQIRISESQLKAFMEKALVVSQTAPANTEELIKKHLDA